MSAAVDTDFLSCLDLALVITRLPAERRATVMRVISKAQAGCLGDDELNAVVEHIRAGAMTVDGGLAVLAAAH